jgi:acyl-coenzyme A synthetase/AMP-(fatty) acid ligase
VSLDRFPECFKEYADLLDWYALLEMVRRRSTQCQLQLRRFIHPEDVYWCMADIGWITGHSYIVYGPLALGASSVVYEGLPTYPDAGRPWRIRTTETADAK